METVGREFKGVQERSVDWRGPVGRFHLFFPFAQGQEKCKINRRENIIKFIKAIDKIRFSLQEN